MFLILLAALGIVCCHVRKYFGAVLWRWVVPDSGLGCACHGQAPCSLERFVEVRSAIQRAARYSQCAWPFTSAPSRTAESFNVKLTSQCALPSPVAGFREGFRGPRGKLPARSIPQFRCQKRRQRFGPSQKPDPAPSEAGNGGNGPEHIPGVFQTVRLEPCLSALEDEDLSASC